MTNDNREKAPPPWYGALRRPPGDRGFTDALAQRTLDRARELRGAKPRRIERRAAAALAFAAAAAIGVVLFVSPGALPGLERVPAGDGTTLAVWEDGRKTIEALPGGGLAAGAPAGAWWNFYDSPEELIGRSIRIEATHGPTGIGVQELKETTLTEEHLYDGRFLRVPSRLALPLSGRWTFRIFMNGKAAGTVAMDVPDGSWEPSGTFRSGPYEMTGAPGVMGYVGPGFVAGKPNKYMWHFWGPPELLTGRLDIEAVRQGSQELQPLFRASLAPGALNGADAARPSGLALPDAGRWRIVAFVEGAMVGSVVVDVSSPTEPTDSATP